MSGTNREATEQKLNVVSASVNYSTEKAEIILADDSLTAEDLIAQVEGAGSPPPHNGTQASSTTSRQLRQRPQSPP